MMQFEIIELEPKQASSEWPFKRYPEDFPESPISLSKPRKISKRSLTELTWQGLDDDASNKLIVVVYCTVVIRTEHDPGEYLWGDHGLDAEVETIFEVTPKSGIVVATNQCG